jgi:hypothetical protein
MTKDGEQKFMLEDNKETDQPAEEHIFVLDSKYELLTLLGDGY